MFRTNFADFKKAFNGELVKMQGVIEQQQAIIQKKVKEMKKESKDFMEKNSTDDNKAALRKALGKPQGNLINKIAKKHMKKAQQYKVGDKK